MTTEKLQPLKFAPNMKTVLWGGEKIPALKDLRLPAGRTVGESWEVSGLTGHESVVATGKDAGLTLRQLVSRYRGRLVGNRVYRRYGNEFPLLVKFIDAGSQLSVQVHPDDDLAMERHGCSGKSEFWYIIHADEGAEICAGTVEPMDERGFVESVTTHTIVEKLKRYPTHAGDCFFLTPGVIHSIGGGNLLLEVQQASDITYRVYDYNRLDGNGQPRQLHTRLAVDAIDYDNITADHSVNYDRSKAVTTLLDSPFFTVERVTLDGTRVETVPMPYDAFLIVTNIAGEAVLVADNVEVPLNQGETVLVPADTQSMTVRGKATLITATV